MKRWLALLAAALLLVATVPLPASAEGDHEEHEYEQEREHEHEHADRERTRSRPAPLPAPQPTPQPAAQPSPPATPPASSPLDLNPLTAAVTALTADPASTTLQAALRRAASAAGTQAPGLWVNGKPVTGALLPGKRMALVSLDRVAEALGAKLTHDKATGAVTLAYAGHQAVLTAGAQSVAVDGQTVAVDEPAALRSSTLYISLRTLAEVTGTQVIYDQETGLVLVSPVR